MFSDQSTFSVRFEWGGCGLDSVGPECDVIIIVDVLSFSTCVDVAVSRGAVILPYIYRDESAPQYAAEQGALLALKDRVTAGGYSLSPTSLTTIPSGTRLVLPSPNGSTLSLRAAGYTTTLTACLRNATAAAYSAARGRSTISVIAAGELWDDGSLRPAWEDFVGAGAVIAHLPGLRSPEAQAACDVFIQAKRQLPQLLRDCSSGRELIERGFAADVDLAAEFDVSTCVPYLKDNAYVAEPIESAGDPDIPEFGTPVAGADYMLRPGGYALIFNTSGEVAVVSTPNGLMLPGGGQNPGETPEVAALREVEEECGLQIRLGDCIGTADELVFAAGDQTHYRKRCTFFSAELVARSSLGEQDHTLFWLSPLDAAEKLRHESQRWAVVQARRRTRHST